MYWFDSSYFLNPKYPKLKHLYIRDKMLKLGPKEMKGEIWDEGGKSEIVQILISHEEDTIKAMQFAYVVDGKVLLSQIYGKLTGLNFDRVTFNRPYEYLVSISGEYDCGTLVSVAFRTNHKKYGPFGGSDDSESGYDKFKYNFGSSFGGFHGSFDNSCVRSIGVYVKPVSSLAEISIACDTDGDTDSESDNDSEE